MVEARAGMGNFIHMKPHKYLYIPQFKLVPVSKRLLVTRHWFVIKFRFYTNVNTTSTSTAAVSSIILQRGGFLTPTLIMAV